MHHYTPTSVRPYNDIVPTIGARVLIDPSSVVRESEFALAESMGSVFNKLEVLANKATDGQRLTQEQRQQIFCHPTQWFFCRAFCLKLLGKVQPSLIANAS